MKHSKKLIAVFAAILMLSTLALSACGFLRVQVSSIAFTVDSIELYMGEGKDITSAYVEIKPTLADNKAFTLSSEDPSIVSVNTVSNRITAMAVGETVLTATSAQGGFTDDVTVTVKYAEASNLELTANDADVTQIDRYIVLSENHGKTLEFTAALNKNTDPDSKVTVRITEPDGSKTEKEQKITEKISVIPSEVGEYVLTVSTQNDSASVISDSVYIRVYKPITDSAVEYGSDVLIQEEGKYKPVTFGLTYVSDEANPEPIIEWIVNGKTVAVGGDTFTFTPSAVGKYVVQVKINGELVSDAQGGTSFEIRAKGSTVPQNVWIDYDNPYPKVFIRWDEINAGMRYEIELTNLVTNQVVPDLNTDNSGVKARFTNGSFDATGYMDIFSGKYRVRVKTLADDDGVFAESQFSQPATFNNPLPEEAKPYLENKYFDGALNHYITDEQEFLDYAEYLMLWRGTNESSLNASSGTVYMAYSYRTNELIQIVRDDPTVPSVEAALVWKAFMQAGVTGECSMSASKFGSNAINLRYDFTTDSAPSKRTSGNTATAWNALRPHVNYDASKARNASYEFAIDKRTPVTVTTTDQLYYAAENGFKPVPTSNSAAEKAYNYAKKILRFIITNEMSDVEKAHAIYDFIMWRVAYDHVVTERVTDLKESVKYEAYYLESVLSDSNNNGVCDAMAKAYSLMCNMEGIACLRVCGTAGGGGHAWNKVRIDGNWYIVDCTWGDVSIAMGTRAEREAAMHTYFLITDAEANGEREEEDYTKYPKTATTPYNWYADTFSANDVELDYYIDSRLTLEKEINNLAVYLLSSASATGTDFMVGSADKLDNGLKSRSDYLGIELRLAKGIQYDDVRRAFAAAFTKYGKGESEYEINGGEMLGRTYMLVFVKLGDESVAA